MRSLRGCFAKVDIVALMDRLKRPCPFPLEALVEVRWALRLHGCGDRSGDCGDKSGGYSVSAHATRNIGMFVWSNRAMSHDDIVMLHFIGSADTATNKLTSSPTHDPPCR